MTVIYCWLALNAAIPVVIYIRVVTSRRVRFYRHAKLFSI